MSMSLMLSLCLLPIGPSDQDPLRLEADYRDLHAQLEPAREGVQRPSRSEQIEILQDFILEYGAVEAFAGRAELLKVRTRLASLRLCDFDLEKARIQFAMILRESDPNDHDLRPRALYGLAQVQEMRQQPQEAGATLRKIIRRYEGTRYATYARAALLRLENKEQPGVGKPAARFNPRLDISGKARDMASLLGKPVLLLFWSPEHEAGLEEVRSLLAAARRAGLPYGQVISFGMHGDAELLLSRSKQEGWDMPMIPLASEFLDPIVLAYRIQSLPANCLIGPDGTLLARNLSPSRLERALRSLN